MVSGPFDVHTGRIYSVAFSPNSKRIVSGSGDKTIQVWDTESGDVVYGPFKGHTGPVYAVVFSPDGQRIASGSNDTSIRVWDAESGMLPALLVLDGHTGSVWSVAFSHDGKRIVSGSSDTAIRVWDAESGDMVSGPFNGHINWVRSVAFSFDGKRIVSGSDDKTIRVWDAGPGAVVSQQASMSACDVLPAVIDAKVGGSLYWGRNGWILGPHAQLVLWVPTEYRSGIWWAGNTAVIGMPITTIDLSKYAHGESWQECNQRQEIK